MSDASQQILLIAHGSRLAASNDEVRAVADKLGADLEEQEVLVRSAFLELAEPSIPDGIQECIDSGASQVLVLPYFLAAGRHVSEDIPGLVSGKAEEYPEVEIVLLPHIGKQSMMIDLLRGSLSIQLNGLE